MKCVLINCFGSSNEMRIEPINEYFKELGYETTYITSNFDHHKKERYEIVDEGTIQINVPVYNKNLSMQRIYSHYIFAKQSFKLVEKIKPDVLYVKFPPNILTGFAKKYIMKNKTKLIFDIFDLWPESLPIDSNKKRIIKLPLLAWASIRNRNLKYADVILSECDMFRDELKRYIPKGKGQTLYLMKHDVPIDVQKINTDTIQLCYIGGINNIIDIDRIAELLKEINKYKPTVLHIIGDGESKEKLVNRVEAIGTKTIQYGRVFDDFEKSEIFRQCHFGLNMMKNNVKVGLTLKSIEYLRAGLPLINNIPVDTARFVENEQIGFNIFDNEKEVSSHIANLTEFEITEFKKRARKTFESFFSEDAFKRNLNQAIKKTVLMEKMG